MTGFRTFANDGDLQGMVSRIRDDASNGRRIGEALETIVKWFAPVKARSPGARKVLFLYLKGRTLGCVYKLRDAASQLRTMGVRIYIIGFGTRLLLEELAMITLPERIFRVTAYEHVILGNTKLPSVMVRIEQRLERCKCKMSLKIGLKYLLVLDRSYSSLLPVVQ